MSRVKLADILAAVEAEPEFPGEMDDRLFEVTARDKETALLSLRVAVRETKAGIRDRIVALFGDETVEDGE